MHRLLTALMVCCALAESPFAQGEGDDTINSVDILSESINFSCIDWEPIGICLWMTCTPFGCDFDYSLKVKHYIPDATISAYHNIGENPWTDVAFYSRPTSWAEDGGTNAEAPATDNEQALRFKNADAIGSPGNLFFEALSSLDIFCDPGATAFIPYFVSTIDWLWRDPIVETPWTLSNALRDVGKGRTSFSGLYPRIGFVHQGHDYKAGVVNAQRVADIATRNNQPHIYWPMTWRQKDGWWPPGEVVEGDEETHRWQQLVPEGNSQSCVVFADIDDTNSINDPYSDRLNQKTGYAWNLWRPYRCCEREGSILIYHSGN